MAYRLEEDFWQELVKTSPGYQGCYLPFHYDFGNDDEDDDLDDSSACERKLQKGDQMDVYAKEMLKPILCIPRSNSKERGSNPRGPEWYYKNKQQQLRIKYAAPKSVIRRIHQPR